MSWTDKVLVLLRRMDNFHLPGSNRVHCLRFLVEGKQVGWVPPWVVPSLARFPQVFTSPQANSIALRPTLDSYTKRSEALSGALQQLRDEDAHSCLRGWRGEKYDVMMRPWDRPLMCIERAATSLFGVTRYGVHVNGYVEDVEGRLHMWLSRRSRNKQTYAGKLDNLVAGGLTAGTCVRQTLIRECEEEARISPCMADAACPVATVSYTYEDAEGVFPEIQFVFDLKLPPEFKPEIGDGEVQDFYLWPLEKVKEVVVSTDFKPNSAMVVLDFLIRHSCIHPDAEPHYQDLVTGLHRPLWMLLGTEGAVGG